MFEAWGFGTYIWFAAFLAVGSAWVWFVLPETKGASMEEMDHVFGSNSGEEDAAMMRQARLDVGLTESLEDDGIRAEKKVAGMEEAESA